MVTLASSFKDQIDLYIQRIKEYMSSVKQENGSVIILMEADSKNGNSKELKKVNKLIALPIFLTYEFLGRSY